MYATGARAMFKILSILRALAARPGVPSYTQGLRGHSRSSRYKHVSYEQETGEQD